jgi:hypothetical protein
VIHDEGHTVTGLDVRAAGKERSDDVIHDEGHTVTGLEHYDEDDQP